MTGRGLDACAVVRQQRLAGVRAALRRVARLLRAYSPLANAHSNDFLTADLWRSMLPAALAEQLDTLPEDRTLVDMFLESRDRLAGGGKAEEEEEEPIENLPLVFPDGRFDKSARPAWRHATLPEFVDACAACSLDCLRVLTDVDELPKVLARLRSQRENCDEEEVEIAKENAEEIAERSAKKDAENAENAEENAKQETANRKQYAENAQQSAENAEENAQQSAENAEENAQQSAENAEENAQQSAANAEENAQQSAENAKQSAENAAENAQQSAENAAENAQQSAENAQQSAENAEENAKQSAENAAENAQRRPFVSHAMGVKKSHEVERLSSLCHSLAVGCNCDLLVDVGAGKGYLGACLCLAYGMRVLEIDARDSNSDGARRRRENLEAKWSFLVRKAEGGVRRLPPDEYRRERRIGAGLGGQCESVSAVVQSAGHLTRIVQDCCACGETGLALPPTGSCRFGLVGLHTCGQLASTIVGFFADSPSCRLLVNVGCCYNLIDEENCVNPFEPDSQPIAGFPLSDWLRSAKPAFAIGRNARILASQSLERLSDADDERQMHRSMFYRVVLQQLLKDKLGYTDDAWVVGKIGKRCHSFLQYARLGLARLGQRELGDSLTDAEIEQYAKDYAHVERRLFRFFLLRCLTAPAIEACILLDRLLFLLERDSVPEAHCCRVFDPKTSPRCHALLAFRS